MLHCRFTGLLLLVAASAVVLVAGSGNRPGFAAEPPGGDDWKYDVIYRRQGQPLHGLIIERGANVKIRCISRKPGRPTVIFTEVVPRRDIVRFDFLTDAERTRLQQRLDTLKRDHEMLAALLRSLNSRTKPPTDNGETIVLRPTAWPGDSKIKALGYQSAHFQVIANSRPDLVRWAAINLEQIQAAYVRCLPPRTTTTTTTTILLTRSLAEYHAIAKSRGLNLFNPAFYDPERNQVVCGSDLERLCEELEQVRKYHERLRAKMKESRAELVKVYRGKVPAELLAPLTDAEKQISVREKKNDDTFVRVRERLFTRLYHEAFHAYLNTSVYPARDGALPHWFNEGLAQIFETAIVEVGELRVGHADADRLKAVRGALASGKLMPLTDLLRSTPKQFQVAHLSDQQVSDRYYLASWALAFYLTFEQRLLGTKALDDYVHSLKRGTNVLLAFRDLVGKPLPQFEKEYLQYLKKLRPDGTVGK